MGVTVQVAIDCADPNRLAAFWIEALGYAFEPPPLGYATWEDWAVAEGIPEDRWNDAAAIVDPGGVGPRIYFQKVPEAKAVKNRVHLDVKNHAGMGLPVEERRERVGPIVERLVGLGATRLAEHEEEGGYW